MLSPSKTRAHFVQTHFGTPAHPSQSTVLLPPPVLAITSTWTKTSSRCAGKNGENPSIGKIMWGSEDISILEAEWQQVMK